METLLSSSTANALVQKSLIQPVAEFMARPGKKFRTRLVEIGCELSLAATGKKISPRLRERCQAAAEIIESLHAGALIVDDIQDGSKVRRNGPALHVKYGLPRALNAGNWLYFSALNRIRHLGLSPKSELEAHRDCADILARAHLGQAIDVGTRIDEIPQPDIPSVCMSSLELKTGALMALAMRLGAYVGGGDPGTLEKINPVAHQLGVGLQMFDDAGNFAVPGATAALCPSKRHEDLYLRRPSWVWAYAASRYSEKDFREFVHAVQRLPDESFLKFWIELHSFVPGMKKAASTHIATALAGCEDAFGAQCPTAVNALRGLGQQLESSYV